MKFINISIKGEKREFLSFLSDSHRVNQNMNFDAKRGVPQMKIKETGDKIKIKCEMTGRATKDNGFLVGTYFKGKIKEEGGAAFLKGVIVTAPLYHLVWLLLLLVMIIQCFVNSLLSPIPILFVAFELIMYSGEFKKQEYIRSYLARAASRFAKENHRR